MRELVIGVDIGGTNTQFGFVDRAGNVLESVSIPTLANGCVQEFARGLALEFEKVTAVHPEYNILGIGVGAPNVNYHNGTILHSPHLNWGDEVPFSNEMTQVLGCPVKVTNDANAAAIGEMFFGGAKGMKDFVMFTLGTGLGSGFVVDGKVVYGHTGFAGEIGHTTVNPNGRICACGRRGCLETYVSATGIKRTVYKLLAEHIEPSVLRGVSYDELTAKMITEAAAENDPIALKAFEYTGEVLGAKLADTIVHTSPEAIFLSGGLAKAGEFLTRPAQEHMDRKIFRPFKGSAKLLTSSLLDDNAAVLGAAALGWAEFGSK